MPQEIVTMVNMIIVPLGLVVIMFSMGLSLAPDDFREIVRNPRAVFAGLFGQLICLPPLAVAIAWLFGLPPQMATGLVILAICPGGITSNAITYAARANVALAVVLTTASSLITVFTIPVLTNWALGFYFVTGEVPTLSIPQTMLHLAQMTLLPVIAGMGFRALRPALAERLTLWLRPASLVVLIAVILFSVLISAELVLANLLHAGPAAYVLNALSMCVGLMIASGFGLDRRDTLTIGIEVGIHNATMATFLSLTILKDVALAITPTIYGCIMVINAGLLVKWFRRRSRSSAAAIDGVARKDAA